jgi:fermentation-respiration switch protein FrsA (DUF1100 family)
MATRFNLAERFVYYPMRYPLGNWEAQAHTDAQERWITSPDGTRLHSVWYGLPEASLATLFLHGNGGNVTHRIDHATAIRAAGSAVLILDYRGYGKSQGRPTEEGIYQDAEAAYRALLGLGFAADRIVLHGESLGTAVATDLASRMPCGGLILESPLMSVHEMAAQVLPWLGPLLVRGFDTYGKIAAVHVPVLVIHGDEDEVVPFEQGEAVFGRANEPKQFWRLPGGTHNDLLAAAGQHYVPRLQAFYRTLRSGTSDHSPVPSP